MRNKTVHFPKTLARLETIDKRNLNEKDLSLMKNQVMKITKAVPHLIDLINYLCTYQRHNIGIEGEYYHFTITMPDAIKNALGGVDREQYFRDELNKMYEKRLTFLAPYTTHLISKDAIKIDPIYPKKEEIYEAAKAGKLKRKRAIGFTISFSKLLWGDIYNRKGGAGWFHTPFAFTARLWEICKANGHAQNDYLRIRMLYIYVSLHQNNKGAYITLSDPKQLVGICYKGLERYGWYKQKTALDSDLSIISYLARDGFLEHNVLRPTSFWIDQEVIKIHVNKDYKNAIDYTGEKKEIKN